ncbi:MAG: shikimate dehydrogenase [Eubacteriales bacterium]
MPIPSLRPLHAIFANGCGLEVSYEKIQTDIPQLRGTVERLVQEGYSGFNCTMPLKTDMAGLADTLSEQSLILRSCNTVKVADGVLHGYTTDGDGMALSILNGGHSLDGAGVVVLGAGGSARSIALSLKNKGCRVTVLNRSPENARALCDMLGGGIEWGGADIQSVSEACEKADILINSTSQGMTGFDEFKSFSFLQAMRRDSVVVDAVYNPHKTNLIREADRIGLRTVDGFWMLVYQGVLAFELWTGQSVPKSAIEKAHKIIDK